MTEAWSSAPVGRLMDRAVAAARRSLGHIGFHPPDGAALWIPGQVRIASAWASPPAWSASSLLAAAAPGAPQGLAVAVEPRLEALEAVKKAAVGAVWIGAKHPDPVHRDRFVAAATAAGVAVRVTDDDRVRRLLAPYVHARALGRAFVVLKAAASFDGRIATRSGQSQWITGPAARAAGRRLRSQVDAILVGVDTVHADDPRLTARRAGAHDPVRVVLDSRLRTPLTAEVVQSADRTPTCVLTTDQASNDARRALVDLGVHVVVMPRDTKNRVCVRSTVGWLAERGRTSVLVEGGSSVNGAFVDAGLVDRLVWFGAPILLGGDGRPAVGGLGPTALADALRFERWDVRRVGTDWLIDATR